MIQYIKIIFIFSIQKNVYIGLGKKSFYKLLINRDLINFWH